MKQRTLEVRFLEPLGGDPWDLFHRIEYYLAESAAAHALEEVLNGFLQVSVANQIPELAGQIWFHRSDAAEHMGFQLCFGPDDAESAKLRYLQRVIADGDLRTRTINFRGDFRTGEEVLRIKVVPHLRALFQKIGWNQGKAAAA